MTFLNILSMTSKIISNGLVLSCQKTLSSSTISSTVPLARKQLIDSIIRVDHAGELAANHIYAGQLSILHSNVRVAPIIKHMWEQEREHLNIMERLLAKYDVKPTIFVPLCSIIGASTAMIGEKSAMACTIAVEELIGNHYNNQIKELIDDDPLVHDDLLKLRDEELEHHDTGVNYKGLEAPFYQTLKAIIQTGCKSAIWITKQI